LPLGYTGTLKTISESNDDVLDVDNLYYYINNRRCTRTCTDNQSTIPNGITMQPFPSKEGHWRFVKTLSSDRPFETCEEFWRSFPRGGANKKCQQYRLLLSARFTRKETGPWGTVPELLFEKKHLIPAVQQLLVSVDSKNEAELIFLTLLLK
jgi:hypothetical protein